MINHCILGTNNLERARIFYDATLGALGYPASDPTAKRAVYRAEGTPAFMVGTPLDGEAATHANGGTIGFRAGTKQQIDAFYAAGLANGGTCAGEPGPRGENGSVYAAYLRDPDGNKIMALSPQA